MIFVFASYNPTTANGAVSAPPARTAKRGCRTTRRTSCSTAPTSRHSGGCKAARVNAILASIGFSLDDLQTRARQTSFLLGSLLLPLLQIEEDHPGTYAEVLSETGAFLRHVHSYRWKHRHQRG